MHFDVVEGTRQVREVGIVRSYIFGFSDHRRSLSNAGLEGVKVVCIVSQSIYF